MAKGYKGYKGKLGKKIGLSITAGVVTVGIAFSAWGISKLASADYPQQTEPTVPDYIYPDTEYSDTERSDTEYLETEPSFKHDENVATNPSGEHTDGTTVDTSRPTIQDTPASDNQKDVFNTVLGTLTEKSNDYLSKKFNATSTLKATGINYVKIDKTSGNIEILGQASTGNNKFTNIVAKVSNGNSNLSIYNLSESASAEDAASALYEILEDSNSVIVVVLKQYINISDITAENVTSDILEARLNALTDTQSAEYKHISELFNNNSEVEFSVLLNDRAKTNDGKYSVSITAVVHTGKYVYVSDINLTMDKYLANTALSREIEEQIQDYTHTPDCVSGASLNKALHIINQNINESVNETELAK